MLNVVMLSVEAPLSGPLKAKVVKRGNTMVITKQEQKQNSTLIKRGSTRVSCTDGYKYYTRIEVAGTYKRTSLQNKSTKYIYSFLIEIQTTRLILVKFGIGIYIDGQKVLS